jgi:tetratricopeptide (TPR) repeat protein
VSFWALSEMVRARLGVTDGEPTESVEQKLSAAVEQLLPDADERAWMRPRLATLLGLEAGPTFPREDLFGAWTAFFERVGRGTAGVVLVFDDMQYADAGLFDFLDYLLDAARFPLFVMTIGRPELAETRPAWGTGRRATATYVEPVSDSVMGEIVDALVGGLPAAARATLVERAEGIPLYALETVRSLIDRDAVIPKDGRYILADDADARVDLATLDAPASLQALIAARLDALTPPERQAVQDAAVHGLAFSRDGLAAVSAVPDLEAVLAQLVRKEILVMHEDRFSPERGQYRFVQALVRTVAYDTLARRDRKARHLAVAAYLESTASSDELAAVIARHYVDAIDSARDDADAATLERRAIELLERAGRRAESLGSPDEALRHYLAAFSRDPEAVTKARLLEGMARTAQLSGLYDDALGYGEQARAAYEALGQRLDGARVTALMGNSYTSRGEMRKAIELMTPAYEQLDETPESVEAALALAENLARAHSMAGGFREASVYADRALQLADSTQDQQRVVALLNRVAVIWFQDSKPTGAVALLRAAVELGRDKQLFHALIIPLINTTCFVKNRHLPTALEAGREAAQLIAQVGARDLTGGVIGNLMGTLLIAGEWDEAEALYAEYQAELESAGPYDVSPPQTVINLIRDARGGRLEPVVEYTPEGDPMSELWVAIAHAVVPGTDDAVETSRLLTAAIDGVYAAAQIDDDFTIGWPIAVEWALDVGAIEVAERLVAMVGDAPPGLVNPLAHAHHLRLRALVNRAKGAEASEVAADLEAAVGEFRAFGVPFYLAKALLEHGAPESVEEAREIFSRLGATPWLAKAQTVSVS